MKDDVCDIFVQTFMCSGQEAQLPQRNRATRYVNKFVLCFDHEV